MLGTHIAEVDLRDTAGNVVERTLGAGHYTVWAAPDDLLEAVVSIMPA
jgi:hypothetical protein